MREANPFPAVASVGSCAAQAKTVNAPSPPGGFSAAGGGLTLAVDRITPRPSESGEMAHA